jgi:2-phospho-L-lactate/phosphoenolpyruvate guanylyltransferase
MIGIPASLASDLYVVLTSRGIALSKERLAGALTIAERSKLNRWLLGRTLSVIATWIERMDRCLVVTACSEVLGMAELAGARVFERQAFGHNDAAKVGAAQVAALGARRIVFLPADLPDLTPEALDAFVSRGVAADLVLAPDKDGPGTNAVIAHARSDLEFFFGPGSLAKYVQWGLAHGWRVAVHGAPELAFDLDSPEDYALWSKTDIRGEIR